MTGSEKAMELVRRCFVNHPLSDGDQDQLLRIAELSGWNPALALVCGDLMRSSEDLHFLHSSQGKSEMRDGAKWASIMEDASTAYEGECVNLAWNQRRRLTPAEEMRVFGRRLRGARTTSGATRVVPRFGSVNLTNSLVREEQVEELEVELWGMRDVFGSEAPTGDEALRPYPLSIPHDADKLTTEMDAELRKSWMAHQVSNPGHGIVDPDALQNLKYEFTNKCEVVLGMRTELETFLLTSLATFGSDWHAVSCQLQREAAMLPAASLTDVPPMLWEEGLVRHFNPFLSEAALSVLEEAAVSWLRLCVLEDKLQRLKRWTRSTASHALLRQEMQVERYPHAYARHRSTTADGMEHDTAVEIAK